MWNAKPDLLQGMPEAQLEQALTLGKRITLRGGEKLFAMGDPADIEAILAARQHPVERSTGGVSLERIEELEARIAALEERLDRLE